MHKIFTKQLLTDSRFYKLPRRSSPGSYLREGECDPRIERPGRNINGRSLPNRHCLADPFVIDEISDPQPRSLVFIAPCTIPPGEGHLWGVTQYPAKANAETGIAAFWTKGIKAEASAYGKCSSP